MLGQRRGRAARPRGQRQPRRDVRVQPRRRRRRWRGAARRRRRPGAARASRACRAARCRRSRTPKTRLSSGCWAAQTPAATAPASGAAERSVRGRRPWRQPTVTTRRRHGVPQVRWTVLRLSRARAHTRRQPVRLLARPRACSSRSSTLYFRMSRIGREHIPAEGPVILAANHRSFLDPFVIGTHGRAGPIYFVAKKELFRNRLMAWFLNALGAFPIDRGDARRGRDGHRARDPRARRRRRDLPRGHAHPPGLARARPSAASAAWRSRPARRSSRSPSSAPSASAAAGASARTRSASAPAAPLTLPARRAARRRSSPARSPSASGRASTLQWEWLGGLPPLRRAAVIGAGSWGTGLAVALARAGVEVELGCRTAEQADALARRRASTSATCRGVELPERVHVARAADLELAGARPRRARRPRAARCPPRVAAHGAAIPRARGRPRRSPRASCAARRAAQRLRRRAHAGPRRRRASAAPPTRADALAHGASLVVASADRGLRRQLADAARPGRPRRPSADATSSASSSPARAKNAAALAAAAAAPPARTPPAPPPGKVFAEVDALAPPPRRARPRRSPAWPAPATSSPPCSPTAQPQPPRRRAARPAACPPARSAPRSARPPRRSTRCRCSPRRCATSGVDAPAVDGLADVVEGRIAPDALGSSDHRDRRGAPAGSSGPRSRADRLPCVDKAAARSRVLRALPGAPAGRLLLRVLPGGQPPRRRGPDRADVPAGLPPLRARAARVRRPAAAAVAHPHRAQPRGEPLPRPLAQAADAASTTRRRLRAPHTTEDLVEGRDELARILEGVKQLPDDRREALIMRFALGMDNREIARALGPHRRRDEGAASTAPSGSSRGSSRTRRRASDMSEAVPPTSRRLLRRALAPVEPPDGPGRRALRVDADRAHRARRRRARGLGARRDARPAQLGAPGRRRRRRRRRRHRRSSCCARQRAGAARGGRPTAAARRRRARRCATVVRRGAARSVADPSGGRERVRCAP